MRWMSNENIIQKAACFMLGLFSLIILNNIFFTHIHVLNDNSIIVHAHPFDDSESHSDHNDDDNETEGHSHTTAQLIALGNLHVLYSNPFDFKFDSFEVILDNEVSECLIDFTDCYISRNSGRAPPVFFA